MKRAHFTFILVLAAMAWAPVCAQDFELPPPPAATPPTIDVAMLTPFAQGELLPAFAVEDEALGLITSTIDVAPSGGSGIEAILEDLQSNDDRSETLETMLLSQLRERLPGGGEGLIIEGAAIPPVKDLPPSGWSANFSFRMPRRLIGAVSWSCRITDGRSHILKRLSGSVRLDLQTQAVQIVHFVGRGEKIEADDIKMVPARLSELPAGALLRAEDAIGCDAVSALKTYQWVSDKMVRKANAVERNAPVQMVLSRGGLTIKTPGIVCQGGAIGDVVRVENASGGKTVFARVVSKDEVQVVF